MSADRQTMLKGAFRASLSPPAWKNQLKERCMQRLKQDRHKLLAKLRQPHASVSDEITRLVFSEERREHESQSRTRRLMQRGRSAVKGRRHPVFSLQADSIAKEEGEALDAGCSLDDLMALGKLSETDYLDIVHALEDELMDEMDGDSAEEAEHMMEFEEASLEAMLAGLDLGDSIHKACVDEEFWDAPTFDGSGCDAVHVLCPHCKTGSLRESVMNDLPSLCCGCGFTFRMTEESLHGALLDFQDKMGSAFMLHRDHCPADPCFEKTHLQSQDALRISCASCGHDAVIL